MKKKRLPPKKIGPKAPKRLEDHEDDEEDGDGDPGEYDDEDDLKADVRDDEDDAENDDDAYDEDEEDEGHEEEEREISLSEDHLISIMRDVLGQIQDLQHQMQALHGGMGHPQPMHPAAMLEIHGRGAPPPGLEHLIRRAMT